MSPPRKPSLTKKTVEQLAVAIEELRAAVGRESNPERAAALFNSVNFLRRLVEAKVAGEGE
jgi:tetrahydromethanopterin S-methyltransferase subunit E